MLDAITATQVAMLQDQLRLQTISQNISNMQTPGYKRQLLETQGFDAHYQAQLATVTQQMQASTQPTQGTFVQSQRPNELALSGEGFFTVQTPTGVMYTRRGDFHVNDHGELATNTGALLLGRNGALRVEDQAFTITPSGAVFVDNRQIDQVSIVQFEHPEQLQYLGQGLFASEDTPQPADGSTHVLQGHLEQSNVKSIDEMMDLVKTSRHYEASQRVMRTADNLLSTAINQLGEGNV